MNKRCRCTLTLRRDPVLSPTYFDPGIFNIHPSPPYYSVIMSRYQYQPIGDEARKIRLLSLLPKSRSRSPISSKRDIHLLIHHTDLDEYTVRDFEALSYVWGDPNPPVAVYVGETRLHFLEITTNLAVALEHLQHETEIRVFWIDTICIDQHNLQERSQQVARMGDVYRLAHSSTMADVEWARSL